MAQVTQQRNLPVDRQALYNAITDFENYPRFLDEVVGAERLPGSTAERVRVRFDLEVVKRFSYVLEFRLEAPRVVEWSLVESNFFKKNDGRWLLEEGDGGGTAVTYELDVEMGFLVPKWVSRKLTEVNLPRMFDAFEKHARSGS